MTLKKLILIDSHALIHRAFHALPPTMSSKGIPTNAVYGFASVMLKMIKDLRPDYIAAAFDLPGPTFRHTEFDEYKINRAKAPDELHAQISIVRELVRNFGIPIYEQPGYEADDLIGSLAQRAKKLKDIQVIIMTGDLDTLQLIEDDKVVVFTLRKGVTDTVTYNEEEVAQRYGLKPHQLLDYKGLKGDPSDNIPGVPGIGDKTASVLIKEFGSIEKLYEFLDRSVGPKKKKVKTSISDKLAEKLIANKDMAFFSKKLATIICDLDIDFSLEKADWRKNLTQSGLETFLKDYGFYSLVKRLPEALTSSSTEALSQPTLIETPTAEPIEVVQVKDMDKVSKLPEVAVDLMIDDNGTITGAALAGSDKKSYVLSGSQLLPKVFQTLDTLYGHDIKKIFHYLLERGVKVCDKIFDTKIAAYLLNPDQRDYDLNKIFYSEFGLTTDQNHSFRPAYIWRLRTILWEKLKSAELDRVFEDIEMPLVKVLAEMELRGIKVDIKAIAALLKSSNKEISKLESKIYELAGIEFNINSPAQLSDVLFNRLGLKAKIKKTGGGALSTAASELEKLRELHPIIDLISDYRELQKLRTTYIEPFPGLVKGDGRIHTTYNQTVAATGRLSSQDPNLQNIPVRTELGQEFRKVFVAEKGFSLVAFDYTQLELRLVAHIAGDEKMSEAFRRGEDIHTRTAVEIFKVKPAEVTKEMRRQAKALNFGLIYGMGSLGFSRASGVDRNKAKEFIDAYFKEFSGVAKYMLDMRSKAASDGYVETIFGRKRYLADINSRIPQLKAAAERMAINHPVQGTEADLIKMAMIQIYDYLHREGLREDIRMLLQVHDELVFEIKEGMESKIIPKIKNIMEKVYTLSVPLTVDVKQGKNWQEMDPV